MSKIMITPGAKYIPKMGSKLYKSFLADSHSWNKQVKKKLGKLNRIRYYNQKRNNVKQDIVI